MRNLLRNNLWMIIVAWCLEVRDYSVMAIGVSILSSFYLLMNVKKISVLKSLIISIIFMIYCYLLAGVTVAGFYENFEVFIVTICLNVGITDEILQKERLNYLYKVFVFTLGAYMVFFISTLLIPGNMIYEVVRLNTLSLIMIIFFPYTSLMLVKVLKKEYQKKLLLDKIERIAKAKEFDIKA